MVGVEGNGRGRKLLAYIQHSRRYRSDYRVSGADQVGGYHLLDGKTTGPRGRDDKEVPRRQTGNDIGGGHNIGGQSAGLIGGRGADIGDGDRDQGVVELMGGRALEQVAERVLII